FGLEPLEEGEGVRGRAGETGDDGAAAEAAQLLGVRLDDGVAHRYLAVAGDDHRAALTQAEDRRAVPNRADLLAVFLRHGHLGESGVSACHSRPIADPQ